MPGRSLCLAIWGQSFLASYEKEFDMAALSVAWKLFWVVLPFRDDVGRGS